ncbi:MAG: tripartite tricarboxylate transporter substrate binding protein [Proteobacteria bacterium]|nr:tripartite tricarboxylate transporter substrate binding protein [Pseudomonadota bacterium]
MQQPLAPLAPFAPFAPRSGLAALADAPGGAALRRTGRMIVAALAALASFAPMQAAVAQAPVGRDWPTRPLRLVVPFPPGSGVDIVSRHVAPRLSEGLGQPVVIDNRGGAGGVVGAEVAAKSPADGYTLLMGTAGILTVVPALTKVNYNVQRDFAPVSVVASVPSALVVHPSLPVKTVRDLVALARARPGSINYASTGNGTLPHLAAEFLRLRASIDIVHVPYKGSAPAITDLLGGQVEMFFANMLSAMPHVTSGRLRAVAVSSVKRSPVLPAVPTMIEAGYPDFEASTWFGLLAPSGVPPEIVQRLHAEVVKLLAGKELQQRLGSEGAVAVGNTPSEFAAYIRSETDKWTRVVKAAQIRAE